MKPGTTQNLTLPINVFQSLMETQDVLLLSADFLKGLVGYTPADLTDDPNT